MLLLGTAWAGELIIEKIPRVRKNKRICFVYFIVSPYCYLFNSDLLQLSRAFLVMYNQSAVISL